MTELPDYLQTIVDEAIDYYENRNGGSLSEIAEEIAADKQHLTSSLNQDKDNLDVLKDLRDTNGICVDSLDTYSRYATSYDPGEKIIEAIVIESLEKLLYDKLQERFAGEA